MDQVAKISAVVDELERELDEHGRATLSDLMALPSPPSSSNGWLDFGSDAVKGLQRAANDDPGSLVHRIFIARLAKNRLAALTSSALPTELIDRTRSWIDFLSTFLRRPHPTYHFEDEDFIKDYRIVTGLSVPAGAQMIDLSSTAVRRAVPRLFLRSPFRAIKALSGKWLQPHTDSRYTAEFSKEGWDNCYAHMAQLFAADRDLVGMSATSWFYDPAIARLSPRLAYLADVPMQWGAVRTPLKVTEFDRVSATSTSPTRRERFEAGEYQPRGYNILWFRDDLLRWARETATQPRSVL